MFGILRTTVVTAIVAYLFLMVFLTVFQRAFIYFPSQERPSFAMYGQAAEGFEVIKTKTEDGFTLEGWVHPPRDKDKPVILWFHGNASDHGNRVYWAQHYIKAGYGVVIAGYRGYGGNPGAPTEKGLFKDAAAWVGTVQSHFEIGLDDIVLYGESLGSGVALKTATEHDVRALILHTPYKSIRAIAEKQYPFFPVRYLMKDQYDSLSRIGQISMPVLMIHGTEDELIPYDHARELYAAAPEPKQFFSIDGAFHHNIYDLGAADAVLSFLADLPLEE